MTIHLYFKGLLYELVWCHTYRWRYVLLTFDLQKHAGLFKDVSVSGHRTVGYGQAMKEASELF